MRKLLTLLFAVFVCAAVNAGDATDVIINCTPVETGGLGSDNWPVTWHTDSGGGSLRQYLAWGDGGGFTINNDTDNSNRVCRTDLGFARITGTYASHTFADVAGCKSSSGAACSGESGTYNATCNPMENHATVAGKVYGILSLDHDNNATTSLFAWDWVDGAYLVQSQLYESTNDGATWAAVSGVAFSETPSDFSNPTFIQYGKAYALNGHNSDGYVYIYSPQGTGLENFSSVDTVFLARVAKANIKTKASYEYFTGTPGNPSWSTNYANRQPVFWYDEDSNSVPDTDKIHWTFAVNYNPRLQRYFAYNNSAPNPSQSASTDTILDIWQSSTPWGPWALLKRFPSFCAPTLADDYLFSFFTFPAWDSATDGSFKLSISGTGTNDRYAVFAGTYISQATDRHVYLNSTGGGTQLNDCPNPAHNVKGTSNVDELNYCTGGSSSGKVIGTVAGTVTSGSCISGGGSVQPVTNGVAVDIDRDGENEFVYATPQSCVYNMAKSNSCEVHAGTYRQAGAQCNANCGDGGHIGHLPGSCNDARCWLASVIAWGFGPNLDGTGYGTSASPGYLRGAVMNSSTDTWDTNGDKVPDGSYAAIISGDSNIGGGTLGVFDETLCSGANNCTGDIYHPLIVGCGGGAATQPDKWKANCSTETPATDEEWVKLDSDGNGTFDVQINALTLAPVNSPATDGWRNVDYFQVKDIEFTKYNQGNDNDVQSTKLRTGAINLNGDGSADGLKFDHIYYHDNSFGAPLSVSNEHNQAAFSDMWNRGCEDFTEIKNSYLEQNNRLLFADEGTPSAALGCSWNIHDNRILVNVLGVTDQPSAMFFWKSFDRHPDGRKKQGRFWNNEVMVKQISSGSTNNSRFAVFENIGNSGGFGLGELWFYGNIFRNLSNVTNTWLGNASFYPSSCTPNPGGPYGTDWRMYFFNNTWDGWDNGHAFLMEKMCRGAGPNALGELFVERNNVSVFTTQEFTEVADPPDPVNATTINRSNNENTDARKCADSGGANTRYFACGTDPVGGSGLAYYAPYAGGGLAGDGSCDPDGDGTNGFDTDGDGDQDQTWTDIAGNTINCPIAFITPTIAVGAVQIGVACTNSGCGDACVGGAETCDDGNTSITACIYGDASPYTQVCDADCIGDVDCSSPMYCGDGTINGSEPCDGAQLGGASCSSLGLGTGTLTCTTCAYNTSGCSSIISGRQRHSGAKIKGGKFP